MDRWTVSYTHLLGQRQVGAEVDRCLCCRDIEAENEVPAVRLAFPCKALIQEQDPFALRMFERFKAHEPKTT